MPTITSTAVVVYDPGRVDPEQVALAGFLGGYRGLTRDASPWTSASSSPSVTSATSSCSRFAEVTSKPSAVSSKAEAELRPRSPGDSAP